MERAKVVKDEVVERGARFLIVYLEAKNSCLVFLSEGEDRLGTLAVAVPKTHGLPLQLPSSVLLGDRNAVLACTFAEYLASKSGKIALVSVYLGTVDEARAQPIFMRLIERAICAKPES